MITAEDAGAGHIRMAQDHVQFLEESPRRQGREFAFYDIVVEGDFMGNDEGQGTEHGRIDGRDDVSRVEGMFYRPFLAAEAEENHRRQFHTGGEGFLPARW